jgi:hypothetical protein
MAPLIVPRIDLPMDPPAPHIMRVSRQTQRTKNVPATRTEWTNWIETARWRDIRQVAVDNGARDLRLEGREWIGPCPICGGDDRLAVNPQRRAFVCRGSSDDDHSKGDAIDLVMHIHGCDLLEAVERITGTFRPDRTRDESAEDRERRQRANAARAAQYARRAAEEVAPNTAELPIA